MPLLLHFLFVDQLLLLLWLRAIILLLLPRIICHHSLTSSCLLQIVLFHLSCCSWSRRHCCWMQFRAGSLKVRCSSQSAQSHIRMMWHVLRCLGEAHLSVRNSSRLVVVRLRSLRRLLSGRLVFRCWNRLDAIATAITTILLELLLTELPRVKSSDLRMRLVYDHRLLPIDTAVLFSPIIIFHKSHASHWSPRLWIDTTRRQYSSGRCCRA